MHLFGMGIFERILTHPALGQAAFAAVANPMFVDAVPDNHPEQTRADSNSLPHIERSGSDRHKAIARAAVHLAHMAPDLAKVSDVGHRGRGLQSNSSSLPVHITG
jgi:hypothetical protein